MGPAQCADFGPFSGHFHRPNRLLHDHQLYRGSLQFEPLRAAEQVGISCHVRAVLAGAFATLGLVACVTITTAPPGPPDAPKLEVFKGEGPPALEPTDAAGLFAVPSLGPTVYYHEEQNYWFRYDKNRWYMGLCLGRELVRPAGERSPLRPCQASRPTRIAGGRGRARGAGPTAERARTEAGRAALDWLRPP